MRRLSEILNEKRFPFNAFVIARTSMPQIKDPDAFRDYLFRQHITSVETLIDPMRLMPTQNDYDDKIVDAITADNISTDPETLTPIVVSSDHFVADGHHRWMAFRTLEKPINALVVELPINKLLAQMTEFAEQ